MKYKIILFFIFILAIILRFYGNNWDQGQHLHPDERFLTMVATDITLPKSVNEYFDTNTSPANPYNYQQYQFFVYGIFPVLFTKTISSLLSMDTYGQLNLIGRYLSGLVDALCVLVIYKILEIYNKKKIGLLASLLYACTVLPIQLSHFYAVDTYLSFTLLLSFFFLTKNKYIPAGIFFGIALACKISALYFLPVVAVFYIINICKNKKIDFISPILFLIFSGIFLRIFQPYIFIDLWKLNPQFLENINTLKSFSDPSGWFPPSVQWVSKTPVLYPIQNIIFWGAGLGLTILSIFSIRSKNKNILFFTSSFWIIFLVIIQGKEFAHTLRYFLPIYPFLCILASIGFFTLKTKLKYILLTSHLLYSLAFLTIYSVPHSRYQASSWIYENISQDKVLSYEYWDDPLPLNIEGQLNTYASVQLAPYDLPDKENKLEKSKDANYIIFSSNRLWGSIPLVPEKYPYTSIWYKDIFQKKSFKKFVSYPGFKLPIGKCVYIGPTNYPSSNSWYEVDPTCNYPGIYLRDDTSEEAFTVYDHPQVLIYAN